MKKFVPTIPFPRDFAVLLKVVLKAFVLETNNALRRTLLHIACDANQIRSHEGTYSILGLYLPLYVVPYLLHPTLPSHPTTATTFLQPFSKLP